MVKVLSESNTYFDEFPACEIDLEAKTGKFPPFILNGNGKAIYPQNDRILRFSVGDKISLLCHSTEKRQNALKMSSVGLKGTAV